uniref:Uncharacterized protein LOC101494327 isoform X2 n=1 Tax=Cicer arietinum TaxID=3827 RepID=A0A3Q7XFL3_CICAR|nr:uncharacterized protein LOC101494327 isoform X2 [Cicer arietinum]
MSRNRTLLESAGEWFEYNDKGMCVSLTSLALTYLFAASMVTPNSIWNSIAGNAFGVVVIVWVAFVVIVIAIYLIVRFFVRSLNKCAK